VKEVKEKHLPEPTDEWVAENSEFSTLEELRADVTERFRQVKLMQARFAWRENSIGALVELVDDDDVPECSSKRSCAGECTISVTGWSSRA